MTADEPVLDELSTVVASSAEARRVLADLDKEHAQAAARLGRDLVWSAQERAIRAQIASVLDRKTELYELYRAARAVKTKLKLSQEIRLLEQSAARLLRDVRTDIPEPEGLRSVKARRAARARWDRDA